jgi:hypothetical protein
MASKSIITKFVSGYDARLNSTINIRETETIHIKFHFSADINCDAIINRLTFNSLNFGFRIPKINKASVKYGNTTNSESLSWIGNILTA